MSQTTGQGGRDPERDEWLKNFKGIPEMPDTENLHNDRPYIDKMEQKRADGLTIEGQIEAIGDAAIGARDIMRDGTEKRSALTVWGSWIIFIILMLVLMSIAL